MLDPMSEPIHDLVLVLVLVPGLTKRVIGDGEGQDGKKSEDEAILGGENAGVG